jgi:hypothetical protein
VSEDSKDCPRPENIDADKDAIVRVLDMMKPEELKGALSMADMLHAVFCKMIPRSPELNFKLAILRNKRQRWSAKKGKP